MAQASLSGYQYDSAKEIRSIITRGITVDDWAHKAFRINRMLYALRFLTIEDPRSLSSWSMFTSSGFYLRFGIAFFVRPLSHVV